MGKPGILTPEVRERLLVLVAENGGNMTQACRDVGCHRQSVYELCERDEGFKKKFDAAREKGIDSLEDEAKRRAFNGELEPIHYKGQLIGYQRKRSDALLLALLKAHRSKYKERHEVTGADGGPLASNVIVYIPDNGRGELIPEADADDDGGNGAG